MAKSKALWPIHLGGPGWLRGYTVTSGLRRSAQTTRLARHEGVTPQPIVRAWSKLKRLGGGGARVPASHLSPRLFPVT